MDYMIIVGALVAIAVILLIIIIAIFKSGRAAAKEYNRRIMHAARRGAGYNDGSKRRPAHAQKVPVQEQEDEDDEEEEEDEEEEVVVRRPEKKQWKIIMENLDTWEKHTYIFYDNIGIGRKRESSAFEKYLIISDDARVSKLHCAIISKGGRLYLKDMESRNGTRLNGETIDRPIVIQKEDVIGIGETHIEIKKILRERD